MNSHINSLTQSAALPPSRRTYCAGGWGCNCLILTSSAQRSSRLLASACTTSLTSTTSQVRAVPFRVCLLLVRLLYALGWNFWDCVHMHARCDEACMLIAMYVIVIYLCEENLWPAYFICYHILRLPLPRMICKHILMNISVCSFKCRKHQGTGVLSFSPIFLFVFSSLPFSPMRLCAGDSAEICLRLKKAARFV